MQHGRLLLLLWEKCLIEEYVLNNTRFVDCTPVIKFGGKIFCEKLPYNIRGNVCVKFQPYTITGYAEITQNVFACYTQSGRVTPSAIGYIVHKTEC